MKKTRSRKAGRARPKKAAKRKAPVQMRAAVRQQVLPSSHVFEEGLARFMSPEGVFYNPEMRRCRDLSSLWVGTRGKLAQALDAFCASGARGLRYKMENRNVGKLLFLDLSQKAINASKANAKLNRISSSGADFAKEDIQRFLLGRSDFDLIEIDPFGSPAPYLHAVMRAGYNLDERYLSITATDMAVLCGAHAAACWKNYGAKPMDNEFCHENALRILLGKTARAAAEENWAVEPQFCYSHRHYLKLLLKLTKGAEGAVGCAKQSMSYVVHCPKCLYHALYSPVRTGKKGEEPSNEIIRGFPPLVCPNCSMGGGSGGPSNWGGGEPPSAVRMNWAGPLWGGKWADEKTIKEMAAELKKRPYLSQEELAPILDTISSELKGPALYYDLHELASRHKMKIPKTEDVIASLTRAGFFASRTHFLPTAIRTDAGLEEIAALLVK
jgi:tRNA (guanine26-N2/guanine27-N2)-dimethyltransferase